MQNYGKSLILPNYRRIFSQYLCQSAFLFLFLEHLAVPLKQHLVGAILWVDDAKTDVLSLTGECELAITRVFADVYAHVVCIDKIETACLVVVEVEDETRKLAVNGHIVLIVVVSHSHELMLLVSTVPVAELRDALVVVICPFVNDKAILGIDREATIGLSLVFLLAFLNPYILNNV